MKHLLGFLKKNWKSASKKKRNKNMNIQQIRKCWEHEKYKQNKLKMYNRITNIQNNTIVIFFSTGIPDCVLLCSASRSTRMDCSSKCAQHCLTGSGGLLAHKKRKEKTIPTSWQENYFFLQTIGRALLFVQQNSKAKKGDQITVNRRVWERLHRWSIKSCKRRLRRVIGTTLLWCSSYQASWFSLVICCELLHSIF